MTPIQRDPLAIIFAFFLLIFSAPACLADDEYPLRAQYPGLSYISTQELTAQYNDVAIVDARSEFEYNVVMINKAVNLPVSKATFIPDLEKAIAKDAAKKLVFYCNGHTCAKSYDAAQKATQDGYKNVYVYDAGIFEWTMANPDKTTLLGETPAKKEKIIPKEALKAKSLNYADFLSHTSDPNTVILDIRDSVQRDKIPDFPNIKNIPLDRLPDLLKQGQFKDNELLIFDAVGKQVEWLQYYLESQGYTNYYFLSGGVKSTP